MGELDLSQRAEAIAFISQGSFLTTAFYQSQRRKQSPSEPLCSQECKREKSKKIRKLSWPCGNNTHLRKGEGHRGKGDLGCWFIFCFHWKKNCGTKFKIHDIQEKTAITGETRNRKVSPQINFLYSFKTSLLNLSCMLFAFIIFPLSLVRSHNIRVE